MQQPDSSFPKWKTLEREVVFRSGRYLTVENHKIELPDGAVIDDWSWVRIPDAVIVVAQTCEGLFLCFRQRKYALEGVALAPPAGMLEAGEDPLKGAQRELMEETGYAASDWHYLGGFCLEPNRFVNMQHLFLARGAYQVAEPHADDLEEQQMLFLERAQLADALMKGEFKALMWTAAVSMALLVS